MRHATCIATLGALLLIEAASARPARADEQNSSAIDGRWGIGAGLGNNSTEVTLIRGHSNKTAWLFNTQVFYGRAVVDDATGTVPFPPPGGDQSRTILAVGPGVRRFLAPSSVLSPYFDLAASYVYQYDASSTGAITNRATANGALANVALGAEYFTPWRFSVAIHSVLAQVQWTESRLEASDGFVSAAQRSRTTTVTAALRPVLFARIYF